MKELPSRSHDAALAGGLLARLDDRWCHTRAVAARADELAPAVPEDDRELLLSAAWWHDLGYSPELVVSGFHPLDGARFLAAEGYPERLCALVAHHSAATFEAEECCLADELADWPSEQSPVADALWMADMTTGPERTHRFAATGREGQLREELRQGRPGVRLRPPVSPY